MSTAFGLLAALLTMHAIWYAMFWRILYRIVTAKPEESLHDAGRDEYEGGSDDEGVSKDNNAPSPTRKAAAKKKKAKGD